MAKFLFRTSIVILLLAAVGMAHGADQAMSRFGTPRQPVSLFPAIRTVNDTDDLASAAPKGTVTLPQALALALARNPELAAFSWAVRAQDGAAIQAGLFPNPILSANGENFGNSRIEGFDGAATTIQASQLFELGGKRAQRIRVADFDRALADWDYETRRLDVITETRRAFAQVAADQKRLSLARELVSLATQVQRTVGERVKAGRVAPLEETKASVATANARMQENQVDNSLHAARSRLAAVWGAQDPSFEQVAYDLDAISAVPPLADIKNQIDKNPDLARWLVEIEKRKADLSLASAKRIPDLTVSVGARNFAETGDTAMVAGLSIPLPLFDRNQGAIRAASAELERAEDLQQAAQTKVHLALSQSYWTLNAIHGEVAMLRDQVLPATHQAFTVASEGYRQGKFGFLDMLDAQRTLFETRSRYLTALATYHVAVAELERLIGISMADVAKPVRSTKTE